MAKWIWLAVSIFGMAVATGCGDDDTKCDGGDCDASAGGSGGGSQGGSGGGAGQGGSGGGDAGSGGGTAGSGGSAGEGGSGGDGGSGHVPDTSWAEVRPDACTEDETKNSYTNLFEDVWKIGAQPRLEAGSSTGATVVSYDEMETVINLRTDANKSVRIQWPSPLGPFAFAVNAKVTLEQTRDWTIIRNDQRLAAAFARQGAIPDEALDPIPFGGPSLRFAMQCNLSDSSNCTLDLVDLQAGAGDTLKVFPSVGHDQAFDDNWRISNRSMLQSPNCPGGIPFRSILAVEGRPGSTR